MPRFVVACAVVVGIAGGCSFDADYRGGHFTCTDNVCPAGMSCVANECVVREDAAVTPMDTADARLAALTCADPGTLAATGGTVTGSTASRSSMISAMCDGSVMNGPDAVYRMNIASGTQVLVTIDGSFAVSAYVLSACSESPQTPMCLTSTAATPGDPLAVTSSATADYWIVVDAATAAASGGYTLTVDVN